MKKTRYILILIFSLVLSTVFLTGCSDRMKNDTKEISVKIGTKLSDKVKNTIKKHSHKKKSYNEIMTEKIKKAVLTKDKKLLNSIMCQYYKEHYENYDKALDNFLNLYGNNVELITDKGPKYASKGVNYFIFDGSINNERGTKSLEPYTLRFRIKDENEHKYSIYAEFTQKYDVVNPRKIGLTFIIIEDITDKTDDTVRKIKTESIGKSLLNVQSSKEIYYDNDKRIESSKIGEVLHYYDYDDYCDEIRKEKNAEK